MSSDEGCSTGHQQATVELEGREKSCMVALSTAAEGLDEENMVVDGPIVSSSSSAASTMNTFQRIAPYFVFFVTMLASLFTFVASWSCQTFWGADLSFGGGGYGIWSLQDSNQQCQLWSVLFFAYTLDAPLRAARFCSMVAMLGALTLISIQAQLLPPYGRVGGWIVGICLQIWLVHSLRRWWRFNLWTTFFILTYFLEVLLVKIFLLEHYSPQTLYKVVRRLAVLCMAMAAGIFLILSSEVCLCETLTEDQLTLQDVDQEQSPPLPTKKYTSIFEGDMGGVTTHYDSQEDCSNQCIMGPTSPSTVAAPLFWLLVAVLAVAIVPLERFSPLSGNQEAQARHRHQCRQDHLAQLEELNQDKQRHPESPQDDEALQLTAVLADTARASNVNKGKLTTDISMKDETGKFPIVRPRLDTATTFNSDEDDWNNGNNSFSSRQSSFVRRRLDSSTTLASMNSDNDNNDDDDHHEEEEENESDVEPKNDPTACFPHPGSHPMPSTQRCEEGLQVVRKATSYADLCLNKVTMTTINENHHDHEEDDEGKDVDDVFEVAGSNICHEGCNDNPNEDHRPHTSDFFDYSGSSISTDVMLHFKRKPSRQRRCNHAVLVIVAILYFFVLLVLLGSFFENRNAIRAPDTSYNFITDIVCAFDPSNIQDFQTFESRELAHLAGYQVAHCGACAVCSNPRDIETYVVTRKTVADSAKKCASVAIFGREEALHHCLKKEIGFSTGCTTCWVENMQMTAKHCMWTCLSSIITGFAESNFVPGATDYGWLNQCVYCDEKRSGPDFVACSGVARRRLGITSEFERNPFEQCPHVDVDYLQANWTDVFGT
jgi:hypothetical protein